MYMSDQIHFPAGWTAVAGSPAPHHQLVMSERVAVHVTTRSTVWEQFGVHAPDWHYCVVCDGVNVLQLVLDVRTQDVDGMPHLEAARRAEEVGAALLRDLAEAEAH